MLIKDGTLNQKKFKTFFKKLTWKKFPRDLSNVRNEFFYIGTYEDDKTIVKATIRPSNVMKLEETFKGLDVNGEQPPQGYRGRTYEFGSTIEISVPDSFVKDVIANLQAPIDIKTQSLNW